MARYTDIDKLIAEYNRVHIGPPGGARRLMENAPVADVVEVKHADWEIVKGSDGREKMVCTACRHQQDLHSTFTYCPNCGAIIHGTIYHEK